MFWTRVDIEQATESQSGTGAVVLSWSALHEDVEARLLPLTQDEKAQGWATPEEHAYEVHLRGAWPDVVPLMRVLADGVHYDIRKVTQPPPFGEPSTVLATVREVP